MNRLFLLMILSTGFLFAEGNKAEGKGGDQFRKAAEEYDAKAQKYYEMSIYTKKLAEIKRKAADLADAGKWDEIKWDEYHKIKEKIAAIHSNDGNKHQESKKVHQEEKVKREAQWQKRKEWHEKKKMRKNLNDF